MHSVSGIAHSQQVTPGAYGGISHLLALLTFSACTLSATASRRSPTLSEG